MVVNTKHPIGSEIALAAHNIPGQSWLRELHWLFHAFQDSHAHVEIGVYCGRSLYASCAGMQHATVFAIDNDTPMPGCWEPGPGWTKTMRRITIEAIQAANPRLQFAEFPDSSVDVARHCALQGLQFDSLFIDGDHAYESVKSDIEAWLPLIRPGGLIAGHDFWAAHPGVMDAVHELVPEFQIVPTTRIWYARV